MALHIGDTAPDFEAETTEGRINFHDWIGDSWAVLFSHPKDFTPVCTTELGYMAKIKPDFDRRNVKIIGLSVDPVDKHAEWAADIAETQGTAPNYPMIGDVDFNVSKLYGMLGADVSGDPADRTAVDNQTVRNVFVIGPDKKVKLDPRLPDDDRAELRRGATGDRLAAAHGEASRRDAGQLAQRGERDHRRLGLERRSEGDLPRRLGVAQALHPDRAAAELRPRPPAPRRSSRLARLPGGSLAPFRRPSPAATVRSGSTPLGSAVAPRGRVRAQGIDHRLSFTCTWNPRAVVKPQPCDVTSSARTASGTPPSPPLQFRVARDTSRSASREAEGPAL